eukprot:TRINITY_DN40446_c0_g1_i1.p1 TRINITY_DN40446_c0_g1~~TRINITY_DN40446_c0_g1_i1.p1  ORF type:complete len:1106 (+),score=148.61 TRINITY_DN40446_c0_g1_i1:33-3350(+)
MSFAMEPLDVVEKGMAPQPHSEGQREKRPSRASAGRSSGGSCRSTRSLSIEMAHKANDATRLSGVHRKVSSSHDADESLRSMRSFASILLHIQDEHEDGPTAMWQNTRASPGSRRLLASVRARFFAFFIVFVVTWALRVSCLVFVFFRFRMWKCAVISLTFEVVEVIFSVKVAFSDSDVKRWTIEGGFLQRAAANFFAVFVLGLCHVVHLKRAFASELHAIEVLRSADGEVSSMNQQASDSEQYPRLAFFTHVPFAVCSWYAFVAVGDHRHGTGFFGLEHMGLCENKLVQDWGAILASTAAASSVLVMSYNVVNLDVGCSSFVASMYTIRDTMKSDGEEPRLGMCYPTVHFFFRAAEVLFRVTFIAQVLSCSQIILGDGGVLMIAAYFAITTLLGALSLRANAPVEERTAVHLVAGFMLCFANMAKYVDRLGFRRPARRVSLAIETLRFAEVVVWLSAFFLRGISLMSQCRKSELTVLVPMALYCLIAVTPLARKRGADLHSTVMRGDVDEVRNLLVVCRGGETVDINLKTKDAKQETPLMLAAAKGDLAMVNLLLSAGALLATRDAKGYTCLHHAVRHLQLETIQILIRQSGAREILQSDMDNIQKTLSDSLRAKHMEAHGKEFEDLLDPKAQVVQPKIGSVQDACMASVRAHLCWSSQLGDLFPESVVDGVPPLAELCSVSALVTATVLGPCARCLLPRSPAGILGSLRRIRHLGEGASGEVIEVENTAGFGSKHSWHTSSSSNLRSPSRKTVLASRIRREELIQNGQLGDDMVSDQSGPKRYAMKLQAKSQGRSDFEASSEVVALTRAMHPFIVKLEMALQTQQFFVLLLELCPNGNLNQAIWTEKDVNGRSLGLPVPRATRYAGQILLALVHLHEAVGMIYRDVKPENVLISSRDEAKLADFGLAHFVGHDSRDSKYGANLSCAGTPGFMATELAYGERCSVDMGNDAVQSFMGAELAVVSHSRSRGSHGSSRGGGFRESHIMANGVKDPFKTDSYSYGFTLEIMLLGEDAANALIQEESDDEQDPKAVLLPLPGDEKAHFERLRRSLADGRLSQNGFDLLGHLTTTMPRRRRRLAEELILMHPFYLETLGCKDLREHLLQ